MDETTPDPVQRAHDQIRQTIIDIGGIISGVADRVKEIINDALKAIFDPLGAALQAQLQIFGDLVGGLLQNLSTTPEFVRDAVNAWKTPDTGGLLPSADIAVWAAQTLVNAFGQRDDLKDRDHIPPDFEGLASDPPTAPDINSYFTEWNQRSAFEKIVFSLLASVLTVGAYAGALHSQEIASLQQNVALRTPMTPLSPPELANAVVQNQVGQDWAQAHALRSGLPPELFKIMVDTAGLPPGVGELLQLWNRGVIQEADVEKGIAEGHTKDKYIPALKELRWWLPTPADIVHWLTREVWVDEFVQRFGMDKELDQQLGNAKPYFTSNAVRDEVIKLFWRAHWTLPSPSMGEAMYHRTDSNGSGETINLPGGATTKRVIGRDDLLRLYRAAGFEPYWRDPMIRVAFDPLTRIDSRRMYLAGQIDDARLFSSYLDLGYQESDAALFLQWMQANKKAQQKKQVEQHIAPVITAMRQAYQRGLIGAAEFKARAVELGEDPDVVDVWVSQLDTERATERADKLRDGLRRLFVDGFITEDEAGNRLQAEGFTSAEWMRLRDDWRIDRELRTFSDDAKASRALTRQNLLTAYRDQLIQEPELRDRLTAMGFHNDEIDLWVNITKFEGAQRVATQAREGIHDDYVDQLIDGAAVRGQLAAIGTPTEAIEAYLRRWTSERRRKTPQISINQIEAAFKNATLAEDKTRDLLKQLRYTSDEIDVLVSAWGQDLSISQQRLQLEQQRVAIQQQQFATRQEAESARSEAARQASAARTAQQEAFAQAQQARSQEAQIARASTAFERASQRQATALTAASARQDKALAAAQDREAKQLAERDKALAQAQQLRQAAQAATDARQQRSLTAAADRQQRTFEQQDKLYQQRVADRVTAEQRAQGYKIAAEQRSQQAQQAKELRVNAFRIQTELRAHRRELEKELRTQAFTVAREQRQQGYRIAGEQRLSERKGALAQAAAQAESSIANLRLQQQQTAAQSAQDVLANVEQQIQSQIGSLPTGQ